MYSCWMTRAPYSRQMSSVRSVLNESTTRISSTHSIDSSVARMIVSLLKVGTSAVIFATISADRFRLLRSHGWRHRLVVMPGEHLAEHTSAPRQLICQQHRICRQPIDRPLEFQCVLGRFVKRRQSKVHRLEHILRPAQSVWIDTIH